MRWKIISNNMRRKSFANIRRYETDSAEKRNKIREANNKFLYGEYVDEPFIL